MFKKLVIPALMISFTISSATAETVRWARAGDGITMDPHAQNEGPTHALNHQIYDSLLQRDMSGAIIPSLATDWSALPDNPKIWRFNLRKGVKFHNGASFDSEDVVFSLNRAMADGSEMKELLSSIKEVRAVDSHVVDIETNGANPLLINNLTNMFMMDKGWSEANDVMTPHDVAKGETNFATMNTNGTGAFMLVSRSVDEKTVLKANPDYWGKNMYPNQVTEIIFALSASMEGETTSYYLYKQINKLTQNITTISKGIAVGNEIEYTDQVTLGRAIVNRYSFEKTVQ